MYAMSRSILEIDGFMFWKYRDICYFLM